MKNQLYFRITFWSFLSCETLQFALIPKPSTKTFWHVESHVSMSLPDYIIYTRLPTFPGQLRGPLAVSTKMAQLLSDR